jgi:alkanesulfonate monooxygenase SsuD/methylene tetrahydromethanopterin reductase-like flavin-dependent oxidoreductase (luciferase family)
MDEAIQIARGLWSERSFTFQGRRYRTDRAELEPKPDRRIPIWLGTYGDRALAATGRLADGWIPSLGFAPPERVPGMRDRILAAARKAGREPEEITCVYNLEVRVDERADPDPSVVSGPSGAVAERMIGFLELGFTAMNLMPTGSGQDEQAERLAREVIPEVRAAA